MKTPSFSEFKTIVEYLSDELVGARLQVIQTNDNGVVLILYRFHKRPSTVYLVFDLDHHRPYCGLFKDNPWERVKKTKPLGLFLNAHARNHQLNRISLNEAYGRIMELHWGGEGEEECVLEFRCIPKQGNLSVRSHTKSLSWAPLQELSPYEAIEQNLEDEIRTLNFMNEQWLRLKGAGGQKQSNSSSRELSPYEKWKKSREKDLQKKEKALEAIALQIEKFRTEPWAEVGEALKSHGLKGLPPEWSPFVNFEEGLSWNIQYCFDKSKAAQNKIMGAVDRQKTLAHEIEASKDMTEENFAQYLQLQVERQSKNKGISRKVEGRVRKFSLESAGLVAYMGKSAADNMGLLRKAKPFDLWLHLKDYPSAHAVLHRNKEQTVADHDLRAVANWLVREGLPEKQMRMGGKFVVVWVECRHVRAIKGDKLGRVTYHNAREILIAV